MAIAGAVVAVILIGAGVLAWLSRRGRTVHISVDVTDENRAQRDDDDDHR